MENILNKLYYCFYLMDRKLHYLSNRVNPLLYLFKIPFFKKAAKKNNEDLFEVYNSTFTDKFSGFNIITAGTILGGVIIGILISSCIVVFRKVFNLYYSIPKLHFIICAVIAMLIVYLYVLKKDKYLIYFKKYEKWTKRQKRKYIIISFFTIIITIAYFFMSLMCC
ncbi:MAG: hypothetical protein H0X63_12030 [Flavobacteriales bacterium]|nr:hypothetical protein [Flavobacteriales bacterium]